MNSKTKIVFSSFFLILFLASFLIFIKANPFDIWIVDENKVYVDDANVYISAEPHTIYDDSWVYFNITSKIYSGDIDIVFGFDTNSIIPKEAEYFNPIWKNITMNYTCSGDYFNYTLNPNYFWCFDNSTGNMTLLFNHSFEYGNLATKTAYWNELNLIEWKNINGIFDSINLNFQGMNKWYYKKNIPIIAGESNLMRIYLEVPKDKKPTHKYWFAIKPSSETLAESISLNHLYALDPWIGGVQQVYDEINDSSINLLLWDNFTQSDSTETTTWNEDTDKMIITADSNGVGNSGNAYQSVQTINLPNLNNINNITFRDVQTDSIQSGGAVTNCAITQIWVFDNKISQVQRCNTGGSSSDDSVWKIEKNISQGTNDFNIYNDGVFSETITANNNIINFTSILNDSFYITHATHNLYYLYYSLIEGVTLNSPLNNTNYTSKNITFNCSAEVYSGSTISNISLWTNTTGIWKLNQSFNAGQNSTNISHLFYLNVEDVSSYIWNCQAFDNNSDESWGINNFTINLNDLTSPNITINSPSSSLTSRTITINATITDNVANSYCYYNITRGASLEVSDTVLNCSQFNKTETLSSDADYILWIWANDTSNNIQTANRSFNVDTSVPSSPGGGGGSITVTGKYVNWTISPDEYNLIMSKNGKRTESIKLINNDIQQVKIAFSCFSEDVEICNYVNFELNETTLPANEVKAVTYIDFTIDLPKNFNKETFDFKIIATDEEGNSAELLVNVNIGIIGSVTNIIEKMFSSTKIFKVPIPNFFISLFSAIIIFGVFNNLILNKNEMKNLISLLIGFVGFTIILILI